MLYRVVSIITDVNQYSKGSYALKMTKYAKLCKNFFLYSTKNKIFIYYFKTKNYDF